jgi:hypothetical protein
LPSAIGELESVSVQAGGAARSLGWRAEGVSASTVRRFLLFGAILFVAASLLIAGTMMVPVRAPVLALDERSRYRLVGIGALTIVAVSDGAFFLGLRRLRKRLWSAPAKTRDEAPMQLRDLTYSSPLAVLRPEVVSGKVIAITAVVAIAMDAAAWLIGLPIWAVAAAAIVPWIPLFCVEGIRKYRHYGLYAVFGAITLLQIGHLGEHTVQVTQVFMFDGDLSRAHGVFGQLDFETVHFVWDSIVWIGLGVLLVRFGGTNRWLWLSFAASSLHEIEHLYLFFVYRFDPTFYFDGGLAGIMGSGGLVGSALARPYLHFAYNVLVIVPLVFAFWDQTVRVHREGRSA